MAAICGVLMMAVLSACSSSPTEPTAFPLAVDMVTGQTLTVEGTDLRLTLDALAPCPPNASCLAGPRARLIARAGGGAPVDVVLVHPFGGLPTPQQVDGYTVALRSFDETPAGVVRVSLIVDRTGTR